MGCFFVMIYKLQVFSPSILLSILLCWVSIPRKKQMFTSMNYEVMKHGNFSLFHSTKHWSKGTQSLSKNSTVCCYFIPFPSVSFSLFSPFFWCACTHPFSCNSSISFLSIQFVKGSTHRCGYCIKHTRNECRVKHTCMNLYSFQKFAPRIVMYMCICSSFA